MIEADCTNCRFHYSGWALQSVWYQRCPNCGNKLSMKLDGRKLTDSDNIPATIEKRIKDLLTTYILSNNQNKKSRKLNDK